MLVMDTNISQNIIEYNKIRCLEKICYAPFSSMYFRIDGTVNHCCYNYSVPIGRYPDNSIADIWHSLTAENNRQMINEGILPKGCDICRDHMLHKRFNSMGALNFDCYAVNNTDGPLVMEFELENTCNLECVMCSAWNSSAIQKQSGLSSYPRLYDKRFVDELRPFLKKLHKANFLGGEPLLIAIYYDIWQAIIEENPQCNICIITNGTILTDKVRDLMSKSNKIHFIISIDSVDHDNYKKIRKNAVLSQVLNNIEVFHEYTKRVGTRFQISTCFMKNNWKDIPALVRFCNKLNVPIYFNIVWNPAEYRVVSLPDEEKDKIESFFLLQKDLLSQHSINYGRYNALIELLRN